MWGLMPIFFSLIITVLIIIVLNPLSQKIGWVDKPDALRKLHCTPTPLTGGVAMVSSFLVTLFISNIFFNYDINFHIMIGIAVMCLIGLWDDKLHLSARFRLLLQSIVGLILVISSNVSMSNLGDIFGTGTIILNPNVSILFSVFCIVGAINAINMIDGLDGLAGGVTLTALLWMLYLSNLSYSFETAILLSLTGCVIGYLCFNLRTPFRKKAAIFMGDAGSTSLGVALVWLLIRLSQPDPNLAQTAFPPVIGLWLVSIPLLDTISLILSRKLNGKSPFKADRDHFHHILVAAGLSDGETTALIIIISALISGIGILFWKLGLSESALLYMFLILAACYYYLIHHTEKLSRLLSFVEKKVRPTRT